MTLEDVKDKLVIYKYLIFFLKKGKLASFIIIFQEDNVIWNQHKAFE